MENQSQFIYKLYAYESRYYLILICVVYSGAAVSLSLIIISHFHVCYIERNGAHSDVDIDDGDINISTWEYIFKFTSCI